MRTRPLPDLPLLSQQGKVMKMKMIMNKMKEMKMKMMENEIMDMAKTI